MTAATGVGYPAEAGLADIVGGVRSGITGGVLHPDGGMSVKG